MPEVRRAGRRFTPTARRLPATKPHTTEWHEARRGGIGGSDASVILGVNPWKSALELWAEKTGRVPPSEAGEAAKWGTLLEPVVLAELADVLAAEGFTVEPSPGALYNIETPWMRCNPDGIVKRDGSRFGVAEIKTAGPRQAREWEAGVGVHALCQVQHSMLVTGLPHAHIAVLIAGQKFRHQYVPFDPELAEIITAREVQFWDCVRRDVPPEPDGSESAARVLRKLYADAEPDDVIEIGADHADAINHYRDLSHLIDGYEAERELIRQRLQSTLGAHEIGTVNGEKAVTWKNVESTRLDTKALRADHPDVTDRYMRRSTSRRFSIA